MHYIAKRGIAIACRPSVCLSVSPSVTLVDQDHIGWKSWKLIARTISPTPSLFVAQRPPTVHLVREEHGEILGRLEVGWENVACWSIKATISLKRVQIEEKLIWRAYKNSPTLFRTVPSANTYGLLFPNIWGSQSPPKTPIAIISGTAKTTNFKFSWYIHRVHPSE